MTRIMRRKKVQEKSSPEKMPFHQIVKYMIERTRLQIYALGGGCWWWWGSRYMGRVPGNDLVWKYSLFAFSFPGSTQILIQSVSGCILSPSSCNISTEGWRQLCFPPHQQTAVGNLRRKNMGWKLPSSPGRAFGREGQKGQQSLLLSLRSSYLNGFMSSMIMHRWNICHFTKEACIL